MVCAAEVQASAPSQKASAAPRIRAGDLDEATLSDLQQAIQSGRETAVSLVRKYQRRIEEIDRRGPALNSVIELNPDGLAIAKALDSERQSRGARGPLHGIPVLIKDNIDTQDRMMTTAGSLALVGSRAVKDAFVVHRLREAGAVILGKTNLSEWANFRSNHSTSGWSARGGQSRNPYALDRNPSGSSSGSAVATAANLCAVAIGTETNGSIISPSSFCGIVGIKPTVGLIGRSGIIPISQSQDTSGPMARTVMDAAILLGALVGMDLQDSATEASDGKSFTDYSRFCDASGLRGARLGMVRHYFGLRGDTDRLFESAIDSMKGSGAIVIDPVEVPTIGKFEDAEFEVLLYEFKAGLNAYLAGLAPSMPVRSLEQLIAFNERTAAREMPYFGQETLIRAQSKGPLTESKYLEALAQCRKQTRAEGIDGIMERHQLDALVAPSGGPAHQTDLVWGDRDAGGSSSLAAVAGYPSLTVPAGFVHDLPVGISFFGRAYSESTLIKIAYAFEQAVKARRPPRFLPTVG
jgi:amidase